MRIPLIGLFCNEPQQASAIRDFLKIDLSANDFVDDAVPPFAVGDAVLFRLPYLHRGVPASLRMDGQC